MSFDALMLSTFDPLIKDLIDDLNKAGFATQSSCQGKTCLEDFEKKKHCDHSFVTFDSDAILKVRKRQAKTLGLCIYNGNMSISAVHGKLFGLNNE
jgi:tRNA(Phe) wybutosine-synthesizing methylase Tyw3